MNLAVELAHRKMFDESGRRFNFVFTDFALLYRNNKSNQHAFAYAQEAFGEPGTFESWCYLKGNYYFDNEQDYLMFSLRWSKITNVVNL